MDGNWNFKSSVADQPQMMNIPVSTPLSRQGSIYSWTLDQIQSNLGKNFGSMNMEELLKNIHSAEETQGMVAKEGLQRQGSITLPRILSQRSVDEVWKYITEAEEHTKNDGGGGRTNIPQIQRQQTLGDITLEEFLFRAGAMGNSNYAGYIHDPSSSLSGNQNTNLCFEFQQKPMGSDLLNNIVPRSRNYGSNMHPHVNGTMSTYQPRQQQQQQQQQDLLQPQQPFMSKPHCYGYGTQLGFTSGQVNPHGIRDSFMGHQENNQSLVPSIATIPSGAMNVDNSPNMPFPLLDGVRKINVGSSLVSPFPYIISDRDRKNNNGISAEKRKVVEKTQRRKIKNRESAARSRARKQAQTMELEAELEKLKKENHELLIKQEELSKMQTKLAKGMINLPERHLRRTQSDIK